MKNVLGMVRRDISKGQVYIEDATGVAQVTKLQNADCSSALGYISDGCCMLLQGALQPNQAFGVSSILEPFMEAREDAITSLRGRCLSGAQPLRCAITSRACHSATVFAVHANFLSNAGELETVTKSGRSSSSSNGSATSSCLAVLSPRKEFANPEDEKLRLFRLLFYSGNCCVALLYITMLAVVYDSVKEHFNRRTMKADAQKGATAGHPCWQTCTEETTRMRARGSCS